jgi:hypothetical protein
MSGFFNPATHGLEIRLKQVAAFAEPCLRLSASRHLNGHDVPETQRVVCLSK